MNYRTLRNWTHFTEWGINFLTGEACSYSMRLLCDLSEKGVEHIRTFLGGNLLFLPKSNWNSIMYHGEEVYDAVASILLPRSIFKDLAAFLLLQDGWDWVIVLEGEVIGMNQEAYEEYCRRDLIAGNSLRIRNPGFSRNQHQMSGRTV